MKFQVIKDKLVNRREENLPVPSAIAEKSSEEPDV